MRLSIKNISLTFAAGCVGGLANMFVVWGFGFWGISQSLGVKIAPHLTVHWLYNRLVWGGLWGFLFLVPWEKVPLPIRGVIYSLGPSLVQLFIVFPLKAHQGMLGLQLGSLTPPLVLFFNAVWGLVTAFWLYRTTER
jgi:hypothetical protein